MKIQINRRIWILITTLILIPSLYTVFQLKNSQYWEGFMGNWLATTIGVVLGIPIALELNNWQQQREATQRSRKILSLLLEELNYNKEFIEQTQKQSKEARELGRPLLQISLYQQLFLKDEDWKLLTNGGEIQWIKNVDILHHLSTAYYHIMRYKDLIGKPSGKLPKKFEDLQIWADEICWGCDLRCNETLASIDTTIAFICNTLKINPREN